MAHTTEVVKGPTAVGNAAFTFTIRCDGLPETDTNHTIYVSPDDTEATIGKKMDDAHTFTAGLHEAREKAKTVLAGMKKKTK